MDVSMKKNVNNGNEYNFDFEKKGEIKCSEIMSCQSNVMCIKISNGCHWKKPATFLDSKIMRHLKKVCEKSNPYVILKVEVLISWDFKKN